MRMHTNMNISSVYVRWMYMEVTSNDAKNFVLKNGILVETHHIKADLWVSISEPQCCVHGGIV